MKKKMTTIKKAALSVELPKSVRLKFNLPPKGYQGNEAEIILRAPTLEALDQSIAAFEEAGESAGMFDIKVLGQGPDPDGGFNAILKMHNFNPFSWIKEKFGKAKDKYGSNPKDIKETHDYRKAHGKKAEAKAAKAEAKWYKKSEKQEQEVKNARMQPSEHKYEAGRQEAITKAVGESRGHIEAKAESKQARRGFTGQTVHKIGGIITETPKSYIESAVAGAQAATEARRAALPEKRLARIAAAKELAIAKEYEKSRIKLAAYSENQRAKVARKLSRHETGLSTTAKKFLAGGGVRGQGIGQTLLGGGGAAPKQSTLPRTSKPVPSVLINTGRARSTPPASLLVATLKPVMSLFAQNNPAEYLIIYNKERQLSDWGNPSYIALYNRAEREYPDKLTEAKTLAGMSNA